jgi:general secretion pathway protein H
MTLIEVLIVMAIIAVVLGGVVLGTGQLASARLRRSAALVAGAVKVGYTRATVTSKSTRLVFDFESNGMWLEEADLPMLVRSGDTTGTGGAEGQSPAELAAIAEGERIVKGPQAPRPSFHPVHTSELAAVDQGAKAEKTVRSLPRGIKFASVQTAHDADPKTEGRAYLYFWPGGQTERASVQLKIGDTTEDYQTVSLLTSPLTGKVTVREGSVPVEIPTDDKSASDREEP